MIVVRCEIDSKVYIFTDPFDCCFNYDGIVCRYPSSLVKSCPDYKVDTIFPENCPLKKEQVKGPFIPETDCDEYVNH